MYKFASSFADFIETQKSKLNNEIFSEILDSIKHEFNYNDFNNYLKEKEIYSIEQFKNEAINLLIAYSYYILEDSVISETEIRDFTFLKRIFRIREGDFIQNKNFEIKEILKMEFIRIYSDHFVDEQEQLLKINLQSLFDLSYDEFEEIKKDEVINSLINGANPKDLDISKIPDGFNFNSYMDYRPYRVLPRSTS